MGCDIHFYVEKKVHDKWEPVEPIGQFSQDKYYSPLDNPPIDELYPNYKFQWDIERNYVLFDLLSNNATGRTDVKCLFEQRDIPDDSYFFSYIKDDADCHTHSCLYLNELVSIDWEFLNHKRYQEIVEHYRNIKNYDLLKDYINVEDYVKFKDNRCVSLTSIIKHINEMKKHSQHEDMMDVRAVFAFDN